MIKDGTLELNLATLEDAKVVLEKMRNVGTDDLPMEALCVLCIVTSLNAALSLYDKRVRRVVP